MHEPRKYNDDKYDNDPVFDLSVEGQNHKLALFIEILGRTDPFLILVILFIVRLLIF